MYHKYKQKYTKTQKFMFHIVRTEAAEIKAVTFIIPQLLVFNLFSTDIVQHNIYDYCHCTNARNEKPYSVQYPGNSKKLQQIKFIVANEIQNAMQFSH